MKTKHTFALTFFLGLVWTGVLFAYSSGPDPAVNGVVIGATCNQSGCHNSFTLNSGTGSVNFGGLPTTWTPGQTYPLTVTIAGGMRYGFQFSAVNNSTNAQAGTLLAASPNDARVSFISGSVGGNTVQFAQHNSLANLSGTFSFRWTAPLSASFGAVRFNVAGNASNSDGSRLGDLIYTKSSIVSPAASDTTPPIISAVTSSGITSSAATITWTTDEASNTQVDFGPTVSYGQSSTLSTTLATSHSVSLTGLSSNTTYHYRVKSSDAAGNLATGSNNTFITAFTISNLGSVSRITDGTGELTTGYGRILAASGNTTPSGVAIFGLRQSGILVTEAGVPDSPLISSGRIYAEVSSNGLVNTGLAIANPNSTAATIAFTIRDTNGVTIRSASTTIAANQQQAKFLDQDPYLSGAGIQGTFSFTSTVPVSVIALRSLLNERTPRDFLITTLPVIDLGASGATGTQVIPHFAAGDGWTTQVILVNPTVTDQTGTVLFLDGGSGSTAAAPRTVSIDGVSATTVSYTVKGNSSKKFVITGATPGTASGSIRIVPTGGGPVPTPLVIFSYKPLGITVSEAGVPVTMGTTFRMFAQLSSSPQILSGISVANATATAGTVTFSVTGLDGSPLGTSVPQTLPPSGQIVGFLDQLIPSLAGQTVQGVLEMTTTVSSISVVGLRARYNERLPVSDFLITTTPPTLATGTPATAERVFPHLVNGGDYTTQVILFSGTTGQTSGGTLSFVKPDGTLLVLDLK